MNMSIHFDQVQLEMYVAPPSLFLTNYCNDCNQITKNIRHLRAQRPALCTLNIILLNHSIVQKIVRVTVWKCSRNCNSNEITTFNKLRRRIICPNCHSKMNELGNERVTGERIQAQVFSFESNCTLRVDFSDKLIKNLQLGASYTLTGYLQPNGLFKAKGLVRYQELQPSLFISSKILHLKLKTSPIRFVFTLAAQLGSNLVPTNAFIHLKLGILFGLASLGNIPPLPIFAVSTDTWIVNELMSLCSKLAPRNITPLPNDCMIVTETKDGVLESGCLPLASGGVCYLGDWSKYETSKNGFRIRAAVESGLMHFQKFKTLPLTCSIWTYSKFTQKKRDRNAIQTLINIFGMPLIADTHNEAEFLDFIIAREVENINQKIEITEDELLEYLRMVSSKTLELTANAEQLLKDYFVASRFSRQDQFPTKALSSLTLLAESHAKLCLKEVTDEEDAIVAIWLLEESVQSLYGKSIGSEEPPVCSYENENMDQYFYKFEKWVRNFISINMLNDFLQPSANNEI